MSLSVRALLRRAAVFLCRIPTWPQPDRLLHGDPPSPHRPRCDWAFCGNSLELLDGGFQIGISRPCCGRFSPLRSERFLADLIFGKPNTSFGKFSGFSTVQIDILAGILLKKQALFRFSLNLCISCPLAQNLGAQHTTIFAAGRRAHVYQTHRPGIGGPGTLAGIRGTDPPRLSASRPAKPKLEDTPSRGWNILNEKGEAALGKPQGSHTFTIDLTTFWQRKSGLFERAVRAVGSQLSSAASGPGTGAGGVGNPAMTPEAGAAAADSVLITRHLISVMPPTHFSGFGRWRCSRLGCWAPQAWSPPRRCGGWWRRVQPALVIAVDALASRRCERGCTTVQLCLHWGCPRLRRGQPPLCFNQETLGVPVYAVVGIPHRGGRGHPGGRSFEESASQG